MRLISFSLTEPQFEARTKTVTRRVGWGKLTAGTRLMGCRKCMGLKPGEKVQRLHAIEVVSVRREPLSAIDAADCVAEGFPEMTPREFAVMFAKSHGCGVDAVVTRIEFRHLDHKPNKE